MLGHPTNSKDVTERWENWSAAGNTAIVATNVDGTLAGVMTIGRMVVLHRPKPVGRITLLVVDETMRGRGVGSALVSAAEEKLVNTGCGLLEITSNARLIGAHGFYEHLGYERTGIRLAKSLAAAG